MPMRPMSEMRMLRPVHMSVSEHCTRHDKTEMLTLVILEEGRVRREVVRALRIELGTELVAAVHERERERSDA